MKVLQDLRTPQAPQKDLIEIQIKVIFPFHMTLFTLRFNEGRNEEGITKARI